MYQANAQRYGTMPYHRCGRCGLKLPAVSLGLWHNFGASKPEQILDNIKAVSNTAFTAEELTEIDRISL